MREHLEGAGFGMGTGLMPWVDSHIHLQPHGERPPVDRALLQRYVDAGAANGVATLAITEHLFRFREAYDLLAGWWESDPNPRLRSMTERYWADHVTLSLPAYVNLIETAKRDGLPLLLGMEMDWIPGRADDLRALLAPYDWDVILGSVHWIGAFAFDDPDQAAEWQNRSVDSVFAEYAALVAELASSGLADVLAHPDLPKLFGHQPNNIAGFNSTIIEAARRAGCAIEINTSGLRKEGGIYPSAAFLCNARKAGVPTSLASDAHIAERVGDRFDQGAEHARSAGYREWISFSRRAPQGHAL
jgi:histidinol-phosphatase (PHP family)